MSRRVSLPGYTVKKISLWGARILIPGFTNGGHLPVGRYSCTPEQAEELLVHNDVFPSPARRQTLWSNLEKYLDQYFDLEDRYGPDLPGPLVNRIWLGGSFVSDKAEPNNVDVTLFLNADTQEAIKGRPGANLFKKSRDSFKRKFEVSPLVVTYRPVVHVFQMDLIDDLDRDYLADRGRWDDWWQRLRSDDSSVLEPTVETCSPRRGYLEVVLDA